MATKKINFNGVVDDIGADAQNVDYTNSNQQNVSNVKGALDRIFEGGLVERNLTSRNIFNPDDAIDNPEYDGAATGSHGNKYIDGQGKVQNGGAANGTDYCHVVGVPVDECQTYCYRLPNHHAMSYAYQSSLNYRRDLHAYKADGTYLGTIPQYNSNGGGFLFTTPKECALIKFMVYQNDHSNPNSQTGIKNFLYEYLRDNLMIERGSVVHDYEPYNAKYLAGVNGNKIGAQHPINYEPILPYNIAFLGDSIMEEAEGHWQTHLTTNYPCKNWKNYAVGGAAFAHGAGTKKTRYVALGAHNRISNQAYRLIYDYNHNGVDGYKGINWKPDIVIISAGTNDRNYTQDIAEDTDWQGEQTDWAKLAAWDDMDTRQIYGADPYTMRQFDHYHGGSTTIDRINYANLYDSEVENIQDFTVGDTIQQYDADADFGNPALRTMGAGLRLTVEMLRKAFPACVVVLCIPIYDGHNGYFRIRHVQKNIAICADYLACPVIDVGKMCGITSNSTWWSNDSLHPNVHGGKYIADVVGHALLSMFGVVKLIDKKKYTISGTTVNQANSETIGSAMFTLTTKEGQTTEISVTSDSNGAFSVEVPSGWYNINQSNYNHYNSLGYIEVKGNISNLVVKFNIS